MATPSPIPPRYNIAPTEPILVVRLDDQGQRQLSAMQWAFVAEWAKNPPERPLFNARVETVAEKPSFRASFKRRRCLVPMTGWYEWQRRAGRSQPYVFRPAGYPGSPEYAEYGEYGEPGGYDDRPAAFAGLYSLWHGPGGEHWLESVAIITAAATGPLADYHARRPLILDPAEYERWLTPHDPLPRNFLDSFNFLPEDSIDIAAANPGLGRRGMEGPQCLEAAPDPAKTGASASTEELHTAAASPPSHGRLFD